MALRQFEKILRTSWYSSTKKRATQLYSSIFVEQPSFVSPSAEASSNPINVTDDIAGSFTHRFDRLILCHTKNSPILRLPPRCPQFQAGLKQFTSIASSERSSQTVHRKLFRGPWIKVIAFVVRIKVLQLVASGAAAFPLLLYLRGDSVEPGEVFGSVLLTTFSTIASYMLWFYGRRYVGELAVVGSEDEPYVRISVLDFWGQREVRYRR